MRKEQKFMKMGVILKEIMLRGRGGVSVNSVYQAILSTLDSLKMIILMEKALKLLTMEIFMMDIFLMERNMVRER